MAVSRMTSIFATAGLLAASFSAHAISFLGTWNGTLDFQSGGGFTPVPLSLVVTGQDAPFTDALSGDIFWGSSSEGPAGCSSYPCVPQLLGVITQGGQGIYLLGFGDGQLSSDDNVLTGKFSFAGGPDSQPECGEWKLTRTASAPEPGSLALFGVGLVGLAFASRRRGRVYTAIRNTLRRGH